MVSISLDPGIHVCHFYTNLREQKEILLPFCRDGLADDECCLLTAAPETVDDWYVELQAYGIDVQEMRERGALLIKAVRGPSEDFNAVRQTREVWRMVQPLLKRFASVRMLRDQPWEVDLALPVEDLCHFELAKDLLFTDTPVLNVCQYDLSNHPPAAIHTALRTHRYVILDGKLHENPVFDGPAILANEPWSFSSEADVDTVDGLLARFR